MPRQFGDTEYQKMFGPNGTGYAPGAIEMSKAAYAKMFSEEAGYPQRDPNQPLVQPLPQARAAAIDPHGVVQGKLQELQTSFKRQADTLRQSGLDPEVHNRILAGWQNEYDQAKGQLTGVQTQLGLIRQGMAAGEMTQEAGREAAIRMIVPRETADLMFPSMKAGDTYSVGQYNAHVNLAKEAGKRTMVDPWGFVRKSKRKHADPDRLIDEYLQYQVKTQYNLKSREEKIQADLAFDEGMAADPKTATGWTKTIRENPKLKALRTYDPGLMGEVGKKVLGTRVSLLAKHFLPKSTRSRFIGAGTGMTYPYTSPTARKSAAGGNRIRVASPDGQTGTIDAGEWEQYQAQGFKRTQ